MNLLRRSLFSRLVLVLLSGLIIAQLLSFAVHVHDRGELIAQASGMQSAQRIADIVRLLESITPSERRKIVQVLSAPPLAISLDRSPLPLRGDVADEGVRATVFATMLRRFLPEGRAVAVNVTETEDVPFMPGAMRGFKGG